MTERSLDLKKFVIKEGKLKEWKEYINKLPFKKKIEIKEGQPATKEVFVKSLIDPVTLILIIGGTAWAISRSYQKDIEKYIEYK